jgi:homoserine kinase
MSDSNPTSPTLRTEAVHVRVPATSANLGPGFDAFGLAVSLHDDVVARVTSSGLAVEVEGEGAATVARDDGNLVVASMRAGFAALGVEPTGLRVGCMNRIPHGRGLGSSAAAIVGGLVAARALVVGGDALLDDDAVLALAADIEGHPDNVAAALVGGFTIAWSDDDRPALVRAVPHPDVVPVACVPPHPVSTELARGLLPPRVTHADAARNAGRAALLVTALTSRPDLLMPATEDWLHQTFRAEAFPGSTALVAALRAAGIPAVVSGAGPTVMALASAATAARVAEVAGAAFAVHRLDVDLDGAVADVLPGNGDEAEH